jgi:hypothetical protein
LEKVSLNVVRPAGSRKTAGFKSCRLGYGARTSSQKHIQDGKSITTGVNVGGEDQALTWFALRAHERQQDLNNVGSAWSARASSQRHIQDGKSITTLMEISGDDQP